MLTGLPPFYSQDQRSMYKSIVHQKLKLPNYLSKACRDILGKLLAKRPCERIGFYNGI